MIRTISAGGVVLNRKGEVLVVNQRGRSWPLPKGHQNPGETYLETALREIYEESGVKDLHYIKPLGKYTRPVMAKDGSDNPVELKTIYHFLFKTSQEELKPVYPHNPEAQWVLREQVSDLLTHPKDKEFFNSILSKLDDATPPTRIILVRHGESEWNIKGLVQGQSQKHNPLTKRGEEQAIHLAHELQDIHIDEIFSSDLLRAKQTANLIASQMRIPLKIAEQLRDQSHGEYEGRRGEEYLSRFTRWNELSDEERHRYTISETAESNETAVQRLTQFLQEVDNQYRGQTLLLVTHGALIRYLLIHLGIGTYDSIRNIPNTAFVQIESNGTDFFCYKITSEKK